MSLYNLILNKIKNLIDHSNRIQKDTVISKDAVIIGSKIGNKTVINEKVIVNYSDLRGEIQIGAKSKIVSSIIKGEVIIGEKAKINNCTLLGKIKIGRYTSLWGPNLDIHSNQNASVTIGNFCSIARNVTFQTFNHNFKKPTSYFIGQNFFDEKWANEKVSKGNIILNNDVWIGTHCIILTGVTIRNGAIVAANSVVTKDVPPYGIMAGSPAKLIGYRFEPSVIQQLEELAWWNWSDEKIAKNKAFFENEISEESLINVKHD
jgi:virginiamycin A acetyltransferase